MSIHVFGRIFMDLFIHGKGLHQCTMTETPGGSAFNASLGFSLLGMETYLHASIGNDCFSEMIHDKIEVYGIKTRYLVHQNEPTNRFVSKNGEPIAVHLAGEDSMSPLGQIGEEAYGLIFATETGQETLERVLTVPWKGLFIDLGPQYLHNRFVYKINDALVIGNEKEALNNPCDVIKRGKNGAKWDEVTVQGNGLDLPYPTGAGDLFDVVLIFLTIMDVSPEKALKEAVRLAQKACMIPGSSTKMELLRDFHHSV